MPRVIALSPTLSARLFVINLTDDFHSIAAVQGPMHGFVDPRAMTLIGPLHRQLADFFGDTVLGIAIVKDVKPTFGVIDSSQDCTMS